MEKHILKAFTKTSLVATLVFIAAVTSANAQSNSLRTNIPFDFIVGEKRLPAGDYIVGRLQPYSGDQGLWIRSSVGDSSAIVLTHAVQTSVPRDKGALVFHRYGDQYFLFRVWTAGSNVGRELPKSSGERAIARRLKAHPAMANKARTETVDIVAGSW